MSGHSKWHNIQATKGKMDAARSKIFTKIGRELAVAVKAGGPDPASNPTLRAVIAKAKQNNMPNDNIDRSIKKAAGENGGVNYESIVYEGYGVGGSAVIVECLTDNKNRTAGDVRHAFDKHGGALGSNGCVSYLFQRKGIIIVPREEGLDSDALMMDALEAGAKDVIEHDDEVEIITAPNEVNSVKEALEKLGYNIVMSQSSLVPDMYVDLDEAKLATFQKMISVLEELDDVQEVYHNVNLPEDEE
mgnify:FL=1